MGRDRSVRNVTERATDVFDLYTVGQTVAFCRALIALKMKAPCSLKLRLAVTGERSVEYLGGPPAVPLSESIRAMAEGAGQGGDRG